MKETVGSTEDRINDLFSCLLAQDDGKKAQVIITENTLGVDFSEDGQKKVICIPEEMAEIEHLPAYLAHEASHEREDSFPLLRMGLNFLYWLSGKTVAYIDFFELISGVKTEKEWKVDRKALQKMLLHKYDLKMYEKMLLDEMSKIRGKDFYSRMLGLSIMERYYRFKEFQRLAGK